MKYRVRGACVILLTLAVHVHNTVWAQEQADSLPPQTSFAERHMRLDWDGVQPPWLGRAYEDQRINTTLDSLNVLQMGIQDEWMPAFTGRAGGV